MTDLSKVRNPSAERVNARVVVSAQLCEKAGIALAYVGLRGAVIEVDEQTGECLVYLDHANHERFLGIESRAFPKNYRDFSAEQWFCSGVLEVVRQ